MKLKTPWHTVESWSDGTVIIDGAVVTEGEMFDLIDPHLQAAAAEVLPEEA